MADTVKNSVLTSSDAVKAALEEYKKIKKDSKNLEIKKQEIIQDANSIIEKLNLKNTAEIQKKESELEIQALKTKEILCKRKVQKTTEEIQKTVLELSKQTIKNMLNEDVQIQLIKTSLEELDKIDLKGVLK